MHIRKVAAILALLVLTLSPTLILHSKSYALDSSTLGANTVADIAEAVAPAVVNIEIAKKMPFGNTFPFNRLPFGSGRTEFYFNGQPYSAERPDSNIDENLRMFTKRDTASGFIVKPEGYILTNAHVVGNADDIKVTLNDRRILPGKVVGIDYFSDVAVVKVNADKLPSLNMGSSSRLRPGDFVIAIGSPLGYDHTVTLGIISAVGRALTDVNGNINFIQTDAAINPGNSGGPLLNLKGEVVGVNTAIRRDAQNIGFSIPVDVAKTVAEELIAHGKVLRPWLGIKMLELNDSLSKSLGLSSNTKGVVIAGFVPNSPAQAAGLKQGDVIQKIDGRDMLTAKDVKDYVQSRKVSDELNFLILRNNIAIAMVVNVGNYPNPHMLNTSRSNAPPDDFPQHNSEPVD